MRICYWRRAFAHEPGGSRSAERRTIVIIAQAVGEYAGASVIASALSDLWLSAQYHLSSLSLSSWLIVGGALVLISHFWLRTSH
jgi:hypothetical protein